MCTLTSSAIATADNFRCWFAEIMPMVLAADISPVQLTACCCLWFFGMNSQYQVCRRIGDDYKVIETSLCCRNRCTRVILVWVYFYLDLDQLSRQLYLFIEGVLSLLMYMVLS